MLSLTVPAPLPPPNTTDLIALRTAVEARMLVMRSPDRPWLLQALATELDERSADRPPAASEAVAQSGKKKTTTPTCRFERDVDFLDEPPPALFEDGVFEDSTEEACCRACAERPWCAAAVLSSAFDLPPSACWLKPTARQRSAKTGVVACIPTTTTTMTTRTPAVVVVPRRREEPPPSGIFPPEEPPSVDAAPRPEEPPRPPPPPPRPPDAASTSSCDFEEGVDFAFSEGDGESPEAGATDERACCKACVRDPTCVAAVLSSASDEPPFACWIKRSATREIAKPGVVACKPRYRAALPRLRTPDKNKAPFSAETYVFRPSTVDPPSAEELQRRRGKIREAVAHAWNGYKTKAWGQDSVTPISGRGVHSGFGCAVTMVDSLDTLWLVGLRKMLVFSREEKAARRRAEFDEAVAYIKTEAFGKKLRSIAGSASVFETTIRVLGGLLGAYELCQDPGLLDRARQIGDRINAAIRDNGVVPGSFGGGGGCPSLAHGGTTQLEMAVLAHHAGEPRLFDKSFQFYSTIRRAPNLEGMWPQCIGAKAGRITMGAESDSFFEYLPKLWLLTGKRHAFLWDMYNTALDGVESRMLARAPDGLLYLDNLDWRGGTTASRDVAMEHLSCFVPAMFALGLEFQTDTARRARHLAIADELATTCFAFYDRQPTRIGPERVKQHRIDLATTNTREYILRPEAAEGWWYLAELVPDHAAKYRDWGWRTFEAMDATLRAPYGHASLRDVSRAAPPQGTAHLLDRMESFWIAETLKYLYLLQDDSHPIPLAEYVLNTEAHPFKMFHEEKVPS